MRIVLGGVAGVAVATALIGWLGDPRDAATFAFFALWGILLLGAVARPVDDAEGNGMDDTYGEGQPQEEVKESV